MKKKASLNEKLFLKTCLKILIKIKERYKLKIHKLISNNNYKIANSRLLILITKKSKENLKIENKMKKMIWLKW